MENERWIFISPHFDDVALSCGGLVWELAGRKQPVEIWTIMGGSPPDDDPSEFARQNHRAWGKSGQEAIQMRKDEDQAACQVLGVSPRHFDWPDAIYRRDPQTGDPLVNNNAQLFSRPPEEGLVLEIAQTLRLEMTPDSQLVLPMGLGNHIDHRAVTIAGEMLERIDLFYADYPYILDNFDHPNFHNGTYQKLPLHLDKEALCAWQAGVLCHKSQLSGLWGCETETLLAINNYLAGGGGRLWQKCQ